MSYGFSQPIGAQPATQGPEDVADNRVLMNGQFVVPQSFYVAKNCESFQSITLSLRYFGINPFPAGGDFLQIQLEWFDSTGTLFLAEPLTFEINSQYDPDFLGKNAYVTIPVRGPSLVLVANAGSGAAPSPSLVVRAFGSNRVVTKAEFGNDQATFSCTDNIILQEIIAAATTPGTTVGPYFAGLASGLVLFSASVAWVTSGGPGQTRFRFGFGTSGVGWPDTFVNQASATSGLASSTFFQAVIPRRPMTVRVTNTGPNNMSNFNFNIIRDER